MGADDSFKDFVLDQLRDVPDLECRRMFGAFGLYSGKTFFAIISDGQLYFKTSAATLPNYTARNSRPFQPTPKQTLKSYYEVPAEIIDHADRLVQWANDAVRAAAPTPRPRPRSSARR